MPKACLWRAPKRSNTLQLDVLDTFETIKIAIAYKIDGEVCDAFEIMIV